MIRLVLDTDANNEIDDQYAIAYLVKSERFDVCGIYACPYLNNKVSTPKEGMEKSYDEIKKILRLSNKFELENKVMKGSTKFLSDEGTPVISEAAKDLIKHALRSTPEKPLVVIAIGCLTNIASALLMEPSIKDLIHIYCLGGVALWLSGTQTEFNFSEDVAAARIVFKKVKNITWIPGPGVASSLTTSEWELRHWLQDKNDLCNYLIEITSNAANEYAKNRPWTRIIWDISAVVAATNNFLMLIEKKINRVVPINGGEFAPYSGEDINYVIQLNRDAIFEDMFYVLSK